MRLSSSRAAPRTCLASHLDEELDARKPTSDQRVAHHRVVPTLDALLTSELGTTTTSKRAVEVHRPRVRERRMPDRFGHLGPQDLGRGVPQVLCVTHLGGCLLIDGHVHNPVHTCG